MKAMLFSAGLGTRLKPFTDKHPKALALVNNKTLLERNIKYLSSFGINQIIINIHHFGNQIVEFLAQNNNFGTKISISDESEEVLETGGGLLKAKKYFLEEDFVVMNVDILTNLNISEFIKFHKKEDALVSLAVSDRESSRKLFFDENKNLKGWKNFKTQESIFVNNFNEQNTTPYAFSGIHVINPQVFPFIKETGKFSIMKTYMQLMKNHPIKGYVHKADLIDVGKPEAIIFAEQKFN